MKGRITKRLFLYILLVVLGFTALILLSNTLLLQPLYNATLKSTMLGAMDQIAAIDYTQETEEWLTDLEELNRGKSFDVVIRAEGEVLFSTSNEMGLYPRKGMGRPDGPGLNMMPFNPNKAIHWHMSETMEDGTTIGTLRMPGAGTELMVCAREVDGATVMLTQPVAPIRQSVMRANILLAGCAVVALIIFSVFAFRMSRRFTKPIRRIQATVGEMAALNFDERCDVKTGDELQSLGEDVNRLGDELQNALETLRKQNAQLEADVEAQKQFISNASHELRTPLSLIKGYADEMNAGFAKGQAQRQAYSKIIAQEADKMNRLLKEMLDLSRMESGRIKMQYETLRVGGQIQAFIEKYEGFIAEHQLDIKLNLTENDTAVFDPMRFEQALANYISNAAKYGDNSGHVEISTAVQNGSIRVSVYNTGAHIPEEKLGSIWDGFFKGDEARTTEESSYGLGLSIVKAIQNVAGQAYGAKNTDGGVVFWFDVQAEPDSQEA